MDCTEYYLQCTITSNTFRSAGVKGEATESSDVIRGVNVTGGEVAKILERGETNNNHI